MSLLSVHACSLVIAVMSVLMIATIVVVVLLAASDAHLFHGELEPRQFGRLFVDTPSWCDGSLNHHTTKPTVDDVVKEVVVLLGCLSVAVALLLSNDTVVRCLCCLTVGVEPLNGDEVEVADVVCCTDGREGLNKDDVEVVIVDCCPDGAEALPFDDVADR